MGDGGRENDIETELFGRFGAVVVSVYGERFGTVQKLEIAYDKFDVAGFDVGVFKLGVTFANFTRGANDKFVTQSFGKLKTFCGFGSDDKLNNTRKVAQINEY